jgi:hypothetical protein
MVKLKFQLKGRIMITKLKVFWPLWLCSFLATTAMSQHGGHMGDPAQQKDRAVFQYLLNQGPSIERNVRFTDNGVETLTESAVPEVAAKIKEHVQAMKGRVEDVRPIRMRDPLFAAIFENAAAISMKVEETEHGVRVTETSEHPYVVKLIQEHAKVVSNFVKYGHQEAMKNHPVPQP